MLVAAFAPASPTMEKKSWAVGELLVWGSRRSLSVTIGDQVVAIGGWWRRELELQLFFRERTTVGERERELQGGEREREGSRR